MLKKLSIAALLLAAAGAGYLLRQELQQNDVAAINAADVATAPVAFALPDLEGNVRNFAEWDGQARIINFWATWCAPCRREIPLLKETQAQHAESGLQVIGIAVDFTEDVINYAQDAQFNYPILVGQEDAMAVAEASGVEFIGLPFTMIVTPAGELLGVHLGEIHAPQIQTIVEQLAALQRGETSFAAAQKALKNL
ncbi:MAG: TlpA disulfide reductase family protein [Woeseia sp.]